METTKVLWSGSDGMNRAIMQQATINDGIEIVAALKRQASGANDMHLRGGIFNNTQWLDYFIGMTLSGLSNLAQAVKHAGVDVLVSFDNPQRLDTVLDLAIRAQKPLVYCSPDVSGKQMEMLNNATRQIPIFHDDILIFKLRNFIDEAVQMAKKVEGDLVIYENANVNCREDLPSRAAKIIQQKIKRVAKKEVEIYSYSELRFWAFDWYILPENEVKGVTRQYLGDEDSNPLVVRLGYAKGVHTYPMTLSEHVLHCEVIGYEELIHDTMEIAKVMAKQPVQPGKFYNLRNLWSKLPH